LCLQSVPEELEAHVGVPVPCHDGLVHRKAMTSSAVSANKAAARYR
jgi:hypothetical protein